MSTVPAPARPCDPRPPQRPWALVLPVKGGAAAKSRLVPPAGVDREDLALAIALDAVTAVAACPAVAAALVVTGDARVAGACAERGLRVVPERRPGLGLRAAVRDGVAAAGPGPVGVLLPDLPALRPADVALALGAVEAALAAVPPPPMAFVPDAEGTGTVLLAALSPVRLRPAFGAGSAAAHAALGAVPVDVGPCGERLRRDVDTAEALAQAVAAGVGPRTAAVLEAAATRA